MGDDESTFDSREARCSFSVDQQTVSLVNSWMKFLFGRVEGIPGLLSERFWKKGFFVKRGNRGGKFFYEKGK